VDLVAADSPLANRLSVGSRRARPYATIRPIPPWPHACTRPG